jgi:nitroimidazol reductase NimA-like FMN-containing flavoprotein (pyridoxamine 5'-phosphate oxidase superfamily)
MPSSKKLAQDISDKTAQLDVIQRSQVCHLAMVDGDVPYVLPFNFGIEGEKIIYLHSSFQGRKIEVLKKNNNVCISFSLDYELYKQSEIMACSWSMKYRSVMVTGKLYFVDELEEKRKALDAIMRQFSENNFKYSDAAINNVCIMRVEIEQMTGRSFRY